MLLHKVYDVYGRLFAVLSSHYCRRKLRKVVKLNDKGAPVLFDLKALEEFSDQASGLLS